MDDPQYSGRIGRIRIDQKVAVTANRPEPIARTSKRRPPRADRRIGANADCGALHRIVQATRGADVISPDPVDRVSQFATRPLRQDGGLSYTRVRAI